ncbi:hypothetical protein SteCoe_14110 [Stentor coeruleus]|uniref:Uncharacterized protein n=1 Tax=Stentor coeruleus TaxID=5963 RepID=A0A1R2C6X0_9CILI|nr:hypothetical protein SteCoe_14110 [Stentor coeruleus]
MKKGFPNIWKNSRPRDSSPEQLLKPTCETPHKTEDIIEKELARLEIELDSSEISALNSKSYDFEPYKGYLESIALLVKQKNPVLGFKILRGVHGWEKIMKRVSYKTVTSSVISSKNSKTFADFSTQTEEEEKSNYMIRDLEVLKFLNLKKSIKRVKIGKLTKKLNEIYDKLKVIQTDIPSIFQNFNLPEINIEVFRSAVEDGDNKEDIEQEIEILKEMQKGFKIISKIDKEIQTEVFRRPTKEYYDYVSFDTEISLVRKKKEFNDLLDENKSLKEEVKKLTLRLESQQKEGNSIASHNNETQEDHRKTSIILKKKEETLKLQLDVVNSKYLKVQNKIATLDTLAFNTKIMWKTAETKLKDISDAWVIQTGKPFKFKSVNFNVLAQEVKNSKDIDENIINKISNVVKFVSEDDDYKNEVGQITEESQKSKENTLRNMKNENSMNTKEILSNNAKAQKITHDLNDDKKQFNQNNPGNPLEYYDEKFSEDETDEGRVLELVNHKKKQKKKNPSIDFDINCEDSSNNHLLKRKQKTKKFEHLKQVPEEFKSATITVPRKLKKILNTTRHIKENPINDESSENAIEEPNDSKGKKLKLSKKHDFKKSDLKKSKIVTPIDPDNNFFSENIKKKSKLNYSKNISEEIDINNFESYFESLLCPEDFSTLKAFISNLIQDNHTSSKAKSEIPEEVKALIDMPYDSPKSICEDIRKITDMTDKTDENLKSLSTDVQKKQKMLIKKVFCEEEYTSLPKSTRAHIQNSLIGHNRECEEICEHLKRVMAIKHKVFGIRYPLKTQLLKYKD